MGSHDVDEKISEAFVALGRLNHCKKKRQLQISGLKAHLDERVGYAYVDARRAIEQQRAILHAQLDKLYRESVNELELHRQAVEEPAQSSLRVLEAHIASAERAGDALKALLGRPEQAEMLPQLQRAVGDVLAVLSASTSLDDLAYPDIAGVSVRQLPPSRLRGVELAAQRGGGGGGGARGVAQEEAEAALAGCQQRWCGCGQRRQGGGDAALEKRCHGGHDSGQQQQQQQHGGGGARPDYDQLLLKALRLRDKCKAASKARHDLRRRLAAEKENSAQARDDGARARDAARRAAAAARRAEARRAQEAAAAKATADALRAELRRRHEQSLALAARMRSLQLMGQSALAATAAAPPVPLLPVPPPPLQATSPRRRVSVRADASATARAEPATSSQQQLQRDKAALVKQVAALRAQLMAQSRMSFAASELSALSEGVEASLLLSPRRGSSGGSSSAGGDAARRAADESYEFEGGGGGGVYGFRAAAGGGGDGGGGSRDATPRQRS